MHFRFQHLLFIFFIVLIGSNALAQMQVAITEFRNESGIFYLDSWENSIPDLLQTQLSRSPELLVLERRKLKAVLEEQALAQTGLTDSSKVQAIGQLLEAEYVIYGTVHKINNIYRIDASIVKVSTGMVQNEKVTGPDQEHLSQMVELLGNNMLYDLTGSGKYQNRIKLKRYPTLYFLGATVGLGIATAVIRSNYEKSLDEYHDNTELGSFNELYDRANNLNKLSAVFASLTGMAFIGTVYCWIRNLSPKEIYAQNISGKAFRPYFALMPNNEVRIGAQIHF